MKYCCEKFEKILHGIWGAPLSVENGQWYLVICINDPNREDNNNWQHTSIHFCPFCGKELSEKNKEDELRAVRGGNAFKEK